MSDPIERRTTFRRIAPTGALGLLWTAAPAICGFYLLGNIETVSGWLTARPSTGLAIYVVVFILASGFGFLPTYAQSILGGWVFGAVAFPAALVGFTGGALIGYFIAKGVSHHEVEHLIEANPKARVVRDALIGHGFWRTAGTVALLRVPPNSPFALTNLAMASAGVPVLPFTLGTFVGMAPRTGVAVFLAKAAADTGAVDIQTFAKEQGVLPLVIGIVVMIVVLAIIGSIANRALKRLGAGQGANDATKAGPTGTDSHGQNAD